MYIVKKIKFLKNASFIRNILIINKIKTLSSHFQSEHHMFWLPKVLQTVKKKVIIKLLLRFIAYNSCEKG